MKPKELFALVVRVLGMLGIMFLIRQTVRSPIPSTHIVVIRLICAVIGFYLIRGAPHLMKFAYPECPQCAEKPAA